MKDLKNKVAIVTGAASGIGRAVSIVLAREGVHLILVDINQAGLDEVKEIITGMKCGTLASCTDVSDFEKVKELCDKALIEMGGVDILVNVAGIGIFAEIKDMEIEDWQRILGVNLYGPIHMIKGVLGHMIDRGSGHIVNVASGCGLVALPVLGGYNTSKFGLVGLSETLRAEVDRHGIGVTAVCPRPVKTNIFSAAAYKGYEPSGILDPILKYTGWTPERVARAILKGIKRNQALMPLSPATMAGYYIKRISNGIIYRLQKAIFNILQSYKKSDR